MNEFTDADRRKADMLADKLRSLGGHQLYVSTADILAICKDRAELNFYYYGILGGENERYPQGH